MTTDTGDKHLSLRQQVRTLDSLVDAQAKTIRELEEKVRVIDAERDKAATLWRGAKEAKAAAVLILGGEDGESLKDVAERAADARIAWDSRAREKEAREGWAQAYRDTLTRAEKAEQALNAAMSVVRENAEGMAACVTAGQQCHYELPYEACQRLMAVLRSDALQHRHTYAPDTGKCSCGHAEADDSR